jgi:hypothetical protein
VVIFGFLSAVAAQQAQPVRAGRSLRHQKRAGLFAVSPGRRAGQTGGQQYQSERLLHGLVPQFNCRVIQSIGKVGWRLFIAFV